MTVGEKPVRNSSSTLLFFAMSLFYGVIVGIVFGIVGSFIYLVIVFPLVMGGMGGYIITKNATDTKTRNPKSLMLSSILTAIVLYGAFHYMKYVGLQASTAIQVFGDFSDKSLEAAKVVVEYSLAEATGHSGFWGYILFKAQQGVSIGKIYSSNKLNLGPIFTWFYWVIELGIIAFITVSIAKGITKKEACEYCGAWYEEPEHIGGVSESEENKILALVQQRDFHGIAKNLEENPDVPGIELYLNRCQSCGKGSQSLLASRTDFVNGQLVFNEVSKTVLTSQEAEILLEDRDFLEK